MKQNSLRTGSQVAQGEKENCRAWPGSGDKKVGEPVHRLCFDASHQPTCNNYLVKHNQERMN